MLQSQLHSGLTEVCKALGGFVCRRVTDGQLELVLGAAGFNLDRDKQAINSIIERFESADSGLGMAGHLHGYDLQVIEREADRITIFGMPARAGAGMLLESMPVAVFRLDPYGRLIYVNPAVEALTGYGLDELEGRGWTKVITEHTFERIKTSLTKGARSGTAYFTNYRILTPLGAKRSLSLSATALLSAELHVTSYLIVITDMSERDELDDRVNWLARHDGLTGLLNRRAISSQIGSVIAQDKHADSALLFIDLDGFKRVNDTYGHDHGDEILKVSARRLKRAIRPHDLVGRMGGDEFAIIGQNLSDADSAEAMAEKVSTVLSAPIAVGGQVHSLRGSVGIALGKFLPERDKQPVDTLAATWLKRADTAMYVVKRAKDPGKTVCIHSEDLEENQLRLAAQRAELESFAEDGDMATDFQPIVTFDGAVLGYEALARPVTLRAHTAVDDLIGTALREGDFPHFFARLSTSCFASIEEFMRAAPASTQSSEAGPISFSINAETQQLMNLGGAEQLLAMLKSKAIDPRQIRVEVAEQTFDRYADALRAAVGTLHHEGVGLCMDNFGTGYSPLRRIVEYGFAQVKIDATIVANIVDGPKETAIVKTLVAMAEATGLDVVAKGVETQAQLDRLKSLGVRSFQGFYFCKPMPWESLVERYER